MKYNDETEENVSRKLHYSEGSAANVSRKIPFLRSDATTVANRIVNNAIDSAVSLLISDPNENFFYKDPTPPPTICFPSFLQFDAEYKEKHINWVSIKEFSINEIFIEIRDYINLWNLTPSTQFVLVIHDKTQIILDRGTRYFIDAIFSKPTRKCPNPLPVAKAYFTVNVPSKLPKHYPIMVKYRFEGFRTHFFALGRKAVQSRDFQRFFIDAILLKKLSFYVRIFECRHAKPLEGTKRKEKKAKRVNKDDWQKEEDDEEEEDMPLEWQEKVKDKIGGSDHRRSYRMSDMHHIEEIVTGNRISKDHALVDRYK